jgi:hypothetical protein
MSNEKKPEGEPRWEADGSAMMLTSNSGSSSRVYKLAAAVERAIYDQLFDVIADPGALSNQLKAAQTRSEHDEHGDLSTTSGRH